MFQFEKMAGYSGVVSQECQVTIVTGDMCLGSDIITIITQGMKVIELWTHRLLITRFGLTSLSMATRHTGEKIDAVGMSHWDLRTYFYEYSGILMKYGVHGVGGSRPGTATTISVC